MNLLVPDEALVARLAVDPVHVEISPWTLACTPDRIDVGKPQWQQVARSKHAAVGGGVGGSSSAWGDTPAMGHARRCRCDAMRYWDVRPARRAAPQSVWRSGGGLAWLIPGTMVSWPANELASARWLDR